jgi:hypothetical protein
VPEPINPPEQLWKYRPWNDHTRALIVSGDVYFSTKLQLNDPFEFRWRERLPIEPAEIDEFVHTICETKFADDSINERRNRFHTLQAELRTLVHSRQDGLIPTLTKFDKGVFCLSEVCDDILMWSHYAGNHSGVCVGIVPSRLTGKRVLRVHYSEEMPVLDAWEYVNHNTEVFVKLSLTKAAHWSYEREWRTIDEVGVRRFENCVNRVIVGAMALPETRIAVRAAVAKAGPAVELYEARMSQKVYGLEIVKAAAAWPTYFQK